MTDGEIGVVVDAKARRHLVKMGGRPGDEYAWGDTRQTWCGWGFVAGHRSLVRTRAEATCAECLKAEAAKSIEREVGG